MQFAPVLLKCYLLIENSIPTHKLLKIIVTDNYILTDKLLKIVITDIYISTTILKQCILRV